MGKQQSYPSQRQSGLLLRPTQILSPIPAGFPPDAKHFTEKWKVTLNMIRNDFF